MAAAISARLGSLDGVPVLVLVGPGNNGGDGLVAARHLAQAGATVKAYCLKPRAAADPQLIAALGAKVFVADAESDQRLRVFTNVLRGTQVLVDALFGTGARRPMPETAAQLLRKAHAHILQTPGALNVAVDCPSGYDCDTGEMDRDTMPAALTVTFGAAKFGQLAPGGADAIGDLQVADIGWPADMPALQAIKPQLATAVDVLASLPPRPRSAHKGTFGTALVVAGSVNYTGAAYLAAAAAYRIGTGLVTAAVPNAIYPMLAGQLPEATWLLLPADMGVIAGKAAAVLRKELGAANALLLGPGWGQEKPTAEFLRQLLQDGERAGKESGMGFGVRSAIAPAAAQPAKLPPTVVDADALKLLTAIDEWWLRLPAPAVLTPHPGEMGVLSGLGRDAVQADRIGVALRCSAQWGHVVLLKGAYSVVAAPDGRVTVQPFATAALARAGTGDVLAGMIVGLLAQGVAPYEAAVAAAYLHGLAGQLAAARVGAMASVLAGDVLAAIPAALQAVGAA
ncbi:MAG: NAD(P)H-hydrate epimerase [Chloroflexi bacterium]|nr:MAG: NAD(P)H-hydrate epimerase [Chloroflexota bacterium]